VIRRRAAPAHRRDANSAESAVDLMEAKTSEAEGLSRARVSRAAAGGLRPLTALRLRKEDASMRPTARWVGCTLTGLPVQAARINCV